MRDALQRAWLRRGLTARLLWPLSILYGALTALRRRLYRGGWLATHNAGVPVVVVGNLVAGGAGKTPVVMALVEHLQARGLRPGVISRGYGRKSTACQEVTPESLPEDAGDEPLLIATRCKLPVFVAARRIEAARALLAAYPATQVIVCDDGLQHYALQRDTEICVFDDRGTGNGWLLPAGPLRETWPRPTDLVLRTGSTPGIAGDRLSRRLADYAVRADGTRITLEQLGGRHCAAVAAIARPEAFFAMLRQRGLQLDRTTALPDHYAFDSNLRLVEAGWELLCTEKDAAKLWRKVPQAWAVPLLVDIDARFWSAFDQRLDAQLSSPHGSKTC